MGRKTFSLPVLIQKDQKTIAGLVVGISGFGLYLISNHYHIVTPQYLLPSIYDSLTPFIPQSIWIYHSAIFLFWLPYFLSRHLKNQNRFLYSYCTLITLSVLCFLIFPTAIHRTDYPIPESVDFLTKFALTLTHWVDSPANCTPSLHVSGAFLGTFSLLHEKRRHKLFPYFFLWAVAVSISTLTTKQHYFIDVVTGLGLAFVTHWFFAKKILLYKVPMAANGFKNLAPKPRKLQQW